MFKIFLIIFCSFFAAHNQAAKIDAIVAIQQASTQAAADKIAEDFAQPRSWKYSDYIYYGTGASDALEEENAERARFLAHYQATTTGVFAHIRNKAVTLTRSAANSIQRIFQERKAQLADFSKSRGSAASCGGAGGGPEDPDPRNNKSGQNGNQPPHQKNIGGPNGRYENNPKHHPNSIGNISRPPIDGQKLLDNSLEISPGYRVWVEGEKFYELRQHTPGKFHAYESPLEHMKDPVKAVLKKAKLLHPKA
jgi:hypothetical protein